MGLFLKKMAKHGDVQSSLKVCLTTFDLLFLGIGAIIGAGIFVITGIVAATQTGPAIILSYILAGMACGFAALSYAELASAIGGCGSAYNYAYAGFGELIAWIVGWDLILEYAISVSAVSVGWSGYCHDFLISLGFPASFHWHPVSFINWNILSSCMILFLTLLLAIGVRMSTGFNNCMVFIKLSVITLFIVIASLHVNPANWTPFMPYGWAGVAEGAALIFFAYIGFDAVSTAVEETIDPQKSMPAGIIGSLLISTILYIVVSGLLTGITHYSTLNSPSPISQAILLLGYKTAAGFIGVGAIAGLTTVMLVMFYGLTRVFFAMSRDGLLPGYFFYTHPRRRTPVRVIVFSGVIMAFIGGLMPMHELAELVNVGTLSAFIIVCSGVIVLRYTQPDLERPFKVPAMPFIPLAGVLCCGYLIINLPWVTLLRFIVWMGLGMLLYWGYGYSHSALRRKS